MKISKQYPPNYNDIYVRFPAVEVLKPIFCYGDTIYNPFDVVITPDLEVHEAVHMRQQGELPDVWWYKYFTDDTFRLQQELEAYGEQYAFIKPHMRGKMLEWGLDNMASALSGELYGRLMTYGEARSKIRNYSKSVV